MSLTSTSLWLLCCLGDSRLELWLCDRRSGFERAPLWEVLQSADGGLEASRAWRATRQVFSRFNLCAHGEASVFWSISLDWQQESFDKQSGWLSTLFTSIWAQRLWVCNENLDFWAGWGAAERKKSDVFPRNVCKSFSCISFLWWEPKGRDVSNLVSLRETNSLLTVLASAEIGVFPEYICSYGWLLQV